MPPIAAFNLARTIINQDEVFIRINDKIDNGAIFCHVDSTRAGIHAIEVITEGYHKWHGAIPIFISKENIKMSLILYEIWWVNHIDILLKIRSLDPRAWTNRYFTEASVSWKLEVELIIGIKEIIFSSIANQIISQFVLDTAISVLIISVVYDRV